MGLWIILNMCEIGPLLAYICTGSSLVIRLIPISYREWFCGRLNVREVVNTNVWMEFAGTHIFKFMCISMTCQGKFNNTWHLLMPCQIQIRKFVQIRHSLCRLNKDS